MKTQLIAVIATVALATATPASAGDGWHHHHHGGGGGWAGPVVGGLAAGAILGGIASQRYYAAPYTYSYGPYVAPAYAYPYGPYAAPAYPITRWCTYPYGGLSLC